MSDFTRLVDLASERLGGVVLWANDDFFAPKENLLRPEKPVFREHEYTDRGKWMDGWETRRRRTPGHDLCVIKLGLPGLLRGVTVDTSYFRGNYPEHCSLEACAFEGADADAAAIPDAEWIEVLPKSPLQGDAQNQFAVDHPQRFTHLRLHIYPDGGVARLRVYGEVLPEWSRVLAAGGPIDLVAVANGGRIVSCSDKFFSSPQNLILPGRGINMGDGWETKRRRGPGFDWVVLRLGIAGTISRVEVDTAHFKGNYPAACSLEACTAAELAEAASQPVDWEEVLPQSSLQPDAQHVFSEALGDAGVVTHVRFNIFPDGGVSRLRVWGTPSSDARLLEGLRRLNALPTGRARNLLLACCGSARWAEQMAERRPFGSLEELLSASDAICAGLGPGDWLEAFRGHPRIGETRAPAEASEQARSWSQQEQSSASHRSDQTRAALAEGNRAYEQRFGYLFIVCATGKSGEEMLAILNQRLANDPSAELRVAAEEQRRITQLRLEKLVRL